MDIIRISRNVTLIAFLLSLLFHGSTIVYIFMQKTNNLPRTHTEEQLDQKEESPLIDPRNPWVATKARAGNFGAPVFFQDEPEQQEAPSQQHHQQQEQEQPHSEQTPAQNSFVVEEDFSDTQTITEQEESQQELDPNFVNTPLETSRFEAKTETVLQEQTQPQTIPGIKKTTAGKKTTRSKKRSRQNNQTSTHMTGPKPPLTLAQLAQGFLHHAHEGGNYGVSILSDRSGLPSEQQLKYERYLQKLGWCLQNSYNINSNRCPAISHDMVTHVFLALNRDGIIQNLNLVKSSGNIHVDQFILMVFREASGAFPPVPNYLPDNPFALTYVISIGADIHPTGFYRR